MIALTARLNERDEALLSMQATLPLIRPLILTPTPYPNPNPNQVHREPADTVGGTGLCETDEDIAHAQADALGLGLGL